MRLWETMPGGPGAGCGEPVLSVLTEELVGRGWLAGEGGGGGPNPAPCFRGEAGSTGEGAPGPSCKALLPPLESEVSPLTTHFLLCEPGV